MQRFYIISAILFFFLIAFLLPAGAEQTVFGPIKLSISAWHTHFSTHSFAAPGPQKGILTLKNDSNDKKVNNGLLLLNGALISVDLKKNPIFEKEVDLKKGNHLIVFLEGQPKASATLEIRTKDVILPPQAEFKAEPASIRPGQTSVLSWTTQNATLVSIDQGIGNVALTGSTNVTPIVNTAYTLTAQGPGGTITKTAIVMVVNQAPIADAQSLSLNEDSNLAITLTGSDGDNDPLIYIIMTNSTHGALSGTAPNLTYTPNPLYHGTDSFSFKVNDGYVDSDSALINLTIIHVNHAPKVNAQSLSLDEDSNLTVTLTGSDADNDPLTYTIVNNPTHGTLSGTAPNLTYVPQSNYNGPDSFTFKVNDGTVDSALATIALTVKPVNDPPTAQDDAAETETNQPVTTSNVLANDTDIDGDTLSIQSFTQPANGTAVNNNNGTFTYTPKTNFSGTDFFNYTVTDNQGGTAQAKVIITVKDPNALPSVSLNAAPLTIPKGGSVTLTWTSLKATKAHLDNTIGEVALQGSQILTPDHTTTYTLTVTGLTGVASASVTVTVLGNPEPQPEGSFGKKYEDIIPPDATLEKYDPKRFALVTGKVLDLANAPIPDVSVTVHQHPEYGTAKTDLNGQYTLPVEGGGVMTFVFQKQGLLTAHRQVHVPWNDFAVGPTIQMIPEDPKATTIAFDGNANNIQTHQSTQVTDAFGARSCTMVFTGDNQAYAVDENGNDIAELPRITTRATEYVTPETMPAILPPTSAYTYCAELNVDGAERMRFAKLVIMWVDNFLGFEVGEIVPVGYYDRDKGAWVPSDNGVVVKLLDTNSDSIVDALDADNDGQPDDLNNNGLFADEVQGLNDPTKYQPGKTFWRVAVSHFTPWDHNWPWGPPPDVSSPNPNGKPDADQQKDDDCPTGCGSSIDDRSRILHQDISIAGTGMTLHYASNHTIGNKNPITVPASGPTVPASLRKILVQVNIAGRTFEQLLDPLPNQKAVFYWDGLDNFGREVVGAVTAYIKIGFQYFLVYYSASNSGDWAQAFGQAGSSATMVVGRQDMYTWQESTLVVYAAGGQSRGTMTEGWSLSLHHYLNPNYQSFLYKGDGTLNTNKAIIINTVAGNGQEGFSGDNGPAVNAALLRPYGITVDAAGNLYIADRLNNRIRKVDTNGIITTIAGNGQQGFSGDNGPAVNAALNRPNGVTVDAAGNLYIADTYNHRIRKVGINGIITTVAGIGYPPAFLGDNGPAVIANLNEPNGVIVDVAGNLLIVDYGNSCIRKVDTNGIITTIVGSAGWGFGGDNGPAANASLSSPSGVAFDLTGNLIIADTGNYRIRKVDTNGIITTIAGNGQQGFSGDNGQAVNAALNRPNGVVVDAAGNLYIADLLNYRIRKVDTNGIINTVAGNWPYGAFSGDGGPPANARLSSPSGVAFDLTNNLYIADLGNNRIRKVGQPAAFKNLTAISDIPFADENGLGYIMSAAGLHKYTIDLDSGVTLLQFGYANNQLVSITDRFSNQTTIQRNSQGVPISFTSPDGLVTTLTIDSNNHLIKVAYEDGGAYDFTYTSEGLMTQKIDPDKHHYVYQYDPSGKITLVSDELGGEWRFARQAEANGDIITQKTTKEGDSTTYVDHTYSTNAYASTITDQTGAVTTYSESGDGLYIQKNLPCGTQLLVTNDVDPLFKFKIPKSQITRMPSGLAQTTQYAKTYQDTNNDKTPDLITETITLNGQAVRMVNNILLGQSTLQSPMGRTVTSNYDLVTLLTSSTQIPGLFATTYNYDPKGRLTKLKTDTRETSFAYTSKGFLESITDPKHQATSYEYDPVGRIKVIHRPDSSTVNFEYDQNGNMTVLTTSNQIDHQFTYNKVDRNDGYVTPKSGAYQYLYDRDRRLTGIKFPSGFDLNYVYDKGRLIQIQTEDQVIGLDYLCSDKVGSISNGADGIAYGYDGSLVTSEHLSGTLNQTLGYTYNNNFQVQSFSYAGATQNYTYDNDQLLTKASDFTITRDPQNGLPTAVSDSKLNLSRTFNGYGEITTENFAVNNLESLILNLSRNDNGQITTKQMTVNGVTSNFAYTYDSMGRLLTVTKDGTLVEEYRYGANGARSYEMNLLRGIPGRSYEYSSEDQLLVTGDFSYRYDVDGFLAIKNVSGTTTTYEYATRGELMKITLPDGNVIEYVNDPLGRRIAKKVNGTLIEKYLWQGLTRLLAIYDANDNILMRFTYADSRLPVAMQSGGATYCLAYDQVGSLRIVTDATGAVIKALDYDSFGNIVQDTNPSFDMPFGFAGGLYDQDTGLVRFGFREYSPEIGRWTAKDPLLFLGGDVDLYGYCLNDPINWIDIAGLDMHHIVPKGVWEKITNLSAEARDVFDNALVDAGKHYFDQPHREYNEFVKNLWNDFFKGVKPCSITKEMAEDFVNQVKSNPRAKELLLEMLKRGGAKVIPSWIAGGAEKLLKFGSGFWFTFITTLLSADDAQAPTLDPPPAD